MKYDVIGNSADRNAWLDARRTGIGASEIGILLGESPWSSEFDLYARKVGELEDPDLSDVEAVEWGVRLEPVVASVFEERTGRRIKLSGSLLRSREHPWALCTEDAEDDEGNPVEIKTTSAFRADAWADGPPELYRIQNHHQMLVKEKPKGSIACLIGGQKFVWCDVERDEELIRKIIYHGREFWRRVQEKDPPAPDGSDATSKALAKLYPKDSGNSVILGDALIELDEQLVQLKAEKKRIDDEIRAAENAIKGAIGEAQIGALPNGITYSWKTQRREEYTVAAKEFRVLRRHARKG